MKSKISVVVAIYNVEQYIERCLHSLFNQTMSEIEYIFVNDCTPDDSMQILNTVMQEYPNRLPYIKIIEHEYNMGQAAARTSGMKAASGDFIIHCDPDDYVDAEMYGTMYEQAIKDKADIAICDFVEEAENGSYTVQHKKMSQNPQTVLRDSYKNDFHSGLWNKLIKRSIFTDNDIYPYPDINFFEDVGIIYRVFLFAKKITYVNKPYYHYNKENCNSISKNFNEKNMNNQLAVVDYLSPFFVNKPELSLCYNYLAFKAKFYLLETNNFKKWLNINRWCEKDIMKFKMYKFHWRLAYYILSRFKSPILIYLINLVRKIKKKFIY